MRLFQSRILYYSYMNSSLDLDHLRTLVAIAECGGFGKAAEARHISQPALSKHVRLLERGLQRKIFEKDGRGMKFTAAGQRVLAEARQILAVHDAALGRLNVDRDRVLVVGSTEHAAEQILPSLLRAIHDALPRVTVRFEIGRAASLSDAIDRGSIDLAYVLDHDDRGIGEEVGVLPLRWFSAPDWAAPKSGECWPLVALEEPSQMREQALQVLTEHGQRAEVVASASTLDGVLTGVRAALGLALLPSAWGSPAQLVWRDELPAAGTATVRLLVRRGLPREFKAVAMSTGKQFFTGQPQLHLVLAE